MSDFVRNKYGDVIRPQQVWEDADPRSKGRTIRVNSIDGRYAQCEVLTGNGGIKPKRKSARILLDRLHPTATGYRLIENPEDQS